MLVWRSSPNQLCMASHNNLEHAFNSYDQVTRFNRLTNPGERTHRRTNSTSGLAPVVNQYTISYSFEIFDTVTYRMCPSALRNSRPAGHRRKVVLFTGIQRGASSTIT